jgi:hypothetical protein
MGKISLPPLKTSPQKDKLVLSAEESLAKNLLKSFEKNKA